MNHRFDESTPASTISFAKDIKPLFRPKDRNNMIGYFDLWSYAAVSKMADAIYERVSDGSMPCDGPWDPTKVDLFKKWMDEGKPA